jgi:beta-glucosidase-like glycosyl hydrolase
MHRDVCHGVQCYSDSWYRAGIPTCADPNLMNGVLRTKWNWDGFVVSDYGIRPLALYTSHVLYL